MYGCGLLSGWGWGARMTEVSRLSLFVGWRIGGNWAGEEEDMTVVVRFVAGNLDFLSTVS